MLCDHSVGIIYQSFTESTDDSGNTGEQVAKYKFHRTNFQEHYYPKPHIFFDVIINIMEDIAMRHTIDNFGKDLWSS
jgi:hypothetical protein